MEQFKAVEKEMKTKAFSKEGLLQGGKQDPREKEREDLCDYLSDTLDEIQRILEQLEAEEASLQSGMKKNKRDTSKSDRLSDLHIVTERFKWHEGKLELLRRALQNDSVEASQVADLKDEIAYVLTEGQVADFEGENDAMYDDFNLEAEEANYGMNNENDKISSQDAQSVPGDPEPEPVKITKVKSDPAATRRPSTQLNAKSPIPQLATLATAPPGSTTHQPPPSKDPPMKPAPIPTRQPGEIMKYASAAAAPLASDKNGVGIAPLPPPLGASSASSAQSPPVKTIDSASPSTYPSQPADKSAHSVPPSVDGSAGHDASKSPTLSQASASAPGASIPSSVPPTPAMENAESIPQPVIADEVRSTNDGAFVDGDDEESIYHLPPGLEDLVQSFETMKSRKTENVESPLVQKLLSAAQLSSPEAQDADRPRHYKPNFRYNTPAWYPQEPLQLFDDPRMYENGKIEPDTLFYIFYYRQGSYQQYLAAKALKSQSWRFHKQYQTWFQRHEEPKTITEEFEQGTYRFFDYESTWYAKCLL